MDRELELRMAAAAGNTDAVGKINRRFAMLVAPKTKLRYYIRKTQHVSPMARSLISVIILRLRKARKTMDGLRASIVEV